MSAAAEAPAPERSARLFSPVVVVWMVLVGIFALVAGPSWFARDKSGFVQPALNAGLKL